MALVKSSSAWTRCSMLSWYNAFSALRSLVSEAWLALFVCKSSSVTLMVAKRPVTGSSMACVRVSISPSSAKICSFFKLSILLFDSRSPLHHVSCLSSASPSLAMSATIFSISWSTMVKGFPACKRARILGSSTDLLEAAAFRRSPCAFRPASWPWESAPAHCLCLLMARLCRKDVAPVLVAATFPNVLKATSLLRMEMASEMAASSLLRSSTR
mmetsp:Transcript_82061/g.166126  ORF Transcript_82061/g.166126 Transcript_82061/m.166126 type:complete len:214 (-) Transcript_82061:1060-1701(-)